MESSSLAAKRRAVLSRWRLWALVPVLLLVGIVSLFAATGSSLVELVGRNPPPADEFDIRRVEFKPGEIRIRVTNPQREDLTIAAVSVDEAIVPYRLEGEATLERLPSAEGFFGYALIGFLVGIVPVALGLLWLPSLRRAAPEWLAAFMALTAGLLTFLAIEALSEALELQAALPSALGGAGLVLLGVAISYLTLTFLSNRLATGDGDGRARLVGGLGLATLV